MTVRELIEMLEELPQDKEILIGMEQMYGSNWAYYIDDEVRERPVSMFYDTDINEAVVLKMNGQCGQVDFSEEDDDDEMC